jgi:hypothetical protein
MYSSYEEYLRHPTFRAVCRQVAKRSSGICEEVGCTNNAFDMHHVRYCKWGEFDTEDNLLHLCRRCHELRHQCKECGGYMKSDSIKLGRDICAKCAYNLRSLKQ